MKMEAATRQTVQKTGSQTKTAFTRFDPDNIEHMQWIESSKRLKKVSYLNVIAI